MFKSVGDIANYIGRDDVYGKATQRFAAGDGYTNAYLVSGIGDVLGAETELEIELATNALKQGRDGRDGGDGLGMLGNPYVQSALGSGIKGLFNSDGGMGFPQVGGTNDFYQSPEGFILPNPT